MLPPLIVSGANGRRELFDQKLQRKIPMKHRGAVNSLIAPPGRYACALKFAVGWAWGNQRRTCGIFVARAMGFSRSSVTNGILADVAPTELVISLWVGVLQRCRAAGTGKKWAWQSSARRRPQTKDGAHGVTRPTLDSSVRSASFQIGGPGDNVRSAGLGIRVKADWGICITV